MPAVSERQQHFFGGVVGGSIPLPKGMTMAQAREFAHKPKHYAEGGVHGGMPPMPRYAGGGQTVNPMAVNIYQWSRDYALSQGANGADAEMFGRSMVAVAYSEVTNFDPNIVNSAGAVGLFQNIPVRGRGGNYTVQQLKDPKLSTSLAAQEMWPIFKSEGGGPEYNRNPLKVVQALSLKGQRPGADAVAAATRDGRFTTGINIGAQASGGSTTAPSTTASAPTPAAPAPAPTRPRAPVDGPITQGYGPTTEVRDGPYQGHAHFNKGIDYGVPPGTPVKSMTGGRVAEVSTTPNAADGFGISVKVDAGDGTIHNYGHLSAADVKVGDPVTPGQVLAKSGNTGISTGPHLSYDIWRVKSDGSKEYIDPNAYAPSATATSGGATAPRGGTAMPSALEQRRDQALKDYEYWDRRERELNQIPNKTPQQIAELQAITGRDAQDGSQINPDGGLRDRAFTEYVNLQKAASDEAKNSPTRLSADKAAETELGWASLAENRRKNDIDIISTLFANDIEAQKLALAVIQQNDLNQEREVSSAIEKGKLTSSDAQAILTGRHNQQVDQLMWAAQGLERAKFIDEANFRNATRMLPAGTRFQPGFEPSSALNQALGMWGLQPLTIAAVEVPRESLDPMANLARGTQSLVDAGVNKPDYSADISRMETLYGEHRNLPTFQSPKGGAQLPPSTAGETDWQSQLSALLSGNQPQPQPVFNKDDYGEPGAQPVPVPPNLVGGEEAPRQNPETGGGPTMPRPISAPVIGINPATNQVGVNPMGPGIGHNPATNQIGPTNPRPIATPPPDSVGALASGPNNRLSPRPAGPGDTLAPAPGPRPSVQPGSITNIPSVGAYFDPATNEWVMGNGTRIKVG